QVFADDVGLRSLAFERDDRKQVVCRIPHIGSAAWIMAFRNPIQTEESHHVIDTESTGVSQGRSDRLDEGFVLRAPQLPGCKRRQTPVLPLGVVLIGWRSHGCAGSKTI